MAGPDGFEHWSRADQIAYWDGCRQSFEEAFNRIQQYVASVLTYIPALAAAGLSVLAVSATASYYLGYFAGLVIGVAGLGMTFEAKAQADPSFSAMQGAIDATLRVEGRMQLPSQDLGLIKNMVTAVKQFSPGSLPLQNTFDKLCYAMLVTFTLVVALSLVGIVLHF